MNKYIKKIKKYIKKNPEHSALLAYNTGVFGWLQANAGRINELHNFTNSPVSWIPTEHIETIKSFVSSFPYGWLIVSFALAFVVKKVKRKTRKLIVWGLILVGLYFMWSYARTSGWF